MTDGRNRDGHPQKEQQGHLLASQEGCQQQPSARQDGSPQAEGRQGKEAKPPSRLPDPRKAAKLSVAIGITSTFLALMPYAIHGGLALITALSFPLCVTYTVVGAALGVYSVRKTAGRYGIAGCAMNFFILGHYGWVLIGFGVGLG